LPKVQHSDVNDCGELMPFDDYTSCGCLHRWYRDAAGFSARTSAVIDPAILSDQDRAAILMANAMIKADEEAVCDLEEARTVLSGKRPARYETYVDTVGATRQRETQAYRNWRAAELLVADVAPEIIALADLRAQANRDGEQTIPPAAAKNVQPSVTPHWHISGRQSASPSPISL
jgi:hypothetical protein